MKKQILTIMSITLFIMLVNFISAENIGLFDKVGIGTTNINPLLDLEVNGDMNVNDISCNMINAKKANIYSIFVTSFDSKINAGSMIVWNLTSDTFYSNTIRSIDASLPYIDSFTINTNTINSAIGKLGKITITNLKGTGNAYVCVNATGHIYRSEVVCV